MSFLFVIAMLSRQAWASNAPQKQTTDELWESSHMIEALKRWENCNPRNQEYRNIQREMLENLHKASEICEKIAKRKG